MTSQPPGLPERLALLPVCPRRKLPVPHTNLITAEGQADFATLDSAKVYQVAQHRLCGICGFPLGYWIVFVGGPRCAHILTPDGVIFRPARAVRIEHCHYVNGRITKPRDDALRMHVYEALAAMSLHPDA